MLIFSTLIYAFFILLDVIPMARNKQWKVLVIYIGLITTAFVLTMLMELGVKLPSPAKPIERIVTAIIGRPPQE